MILLKWLFRLVQGTNGNKRTTATQPKDAAAPISIGLTDNLRELQHIFTYTPDLQIRHLKLGRTGKEAALVYLDEMTDKTTINDNILAPLMQGDFKNDDYLSHVNIGNVKTGSSWKQIEEALFTGESVLLLDGQSSYYIFDTRGWPQRTIDDPQLEASLKGAHQGFLETGTQNIALVRRYIPDRRLKIRTSVVGRRGKSTVWMLYIEDIAPTEAVQELETRLSGLDIDAVINAGELVEYIEDNPYSPFPQFILTERPDAAVSHLLQGRIAVFVDRSPSAIIAPATFISFFQNIDDYSTRWLISSFIRLLRFLAFTIAIFLPAIYIAFISFNYEVIPVQLLFSIAESRARVPFSPLLEALLMEITLEMMRESGIRLPAPIGQTVGIVGGIIIGQTAVQAGIVSNIMVIVVSLTAIASFIIPNYDMGTAIRLLRFPMMLAAFLFGYIGIIIGMMTLIIHLCTLESLGIPYGSPLAPFRWPDMKDAFVRLPNWTMKKRPKSTGAIQSTKQNHDRFEGDSS